MLSPAPSWLRWSLPSSGDVAVLSRLVHPAGVLTRRLGSGICGGNCRSTELATRRIQALQRLFTELACRDTVLKNLAFGFFLLSSLHCF